MELMSARKSMVMADAGRRTCLVAFNEFRFMELGITVHYSMAIVTEMVTITILYFQFQTHRHQHLA